MKTTDLKIPSVCDGYEQDAFVNWARSNGYDMCEHPLHFLFLNDKTDTARQAWKAAIEYANRFILAQTTINQLY